MICIFCKNDSSSSKSVEHIIPESFGSKTKVLPKGIVCDSCNNYFSIKIENPLLSDISFRNLRAYYQVPTKKGKIPSLLGYINNNKQVELKIVNQQPFITNQKSGDEINFDKCSFDLTFNPPMNLMAKLMGKMALESIAYRLIENNIDEDLLVLDEHFDCLREFVRYGNKIKEWPIYFRKIHHPDTIFLFENSWKQVGFGFDIFHTKRRETYFAFNIYGYEFVINFGGPELKGYEEWLIDNNYISPLIERLGWEIVIDFKDTDSNYKLIKTRRKETGILFDKKQMT